MNWMAPVRRAVTAMVLLTMVSVALFAQGLLTAPPVGADLDRGEGILAAHGLPTAEQDPSAGRSEHADPPSTCLHDDACAGGGALNLGDHTIGVIPETMGTPALPVSLLTSREGSALPAAPTLADPKRPPRLI